MAEHAERLSSGGKASTRWPGGLMPGLQEDCIVGTARIPRYGIPTIGSMLPDYTNSEADHIFLAYTKAGFAPIKELPDNMKALEVTKRRHAKQLAARTLLVSDNLNAEGKRTNAPLKATSTVQGLFSEFEYIPSEFDTERELAAIQRVEGEAKRLQVSGKEFIPSGTQRPLGAKWLDNFVDGVAYPYLTDPFEGPEMIIQQIKWHDELLQVSGPFVSANTGRHLDDEPTQTLQTEIMSQLWDLIANDWEGSVMSVYPNSKGFWIIKVELDSIDAEEGLIAYMNVLGRGNAIVRQWKLAKVVEHWNITPGDGNIYFAFRPPWVKQNTLDAYFTLHPEARSYRASVVFEEFTRSGTLTPKQVQQASPRPASFASGRPPTARSRSASPSHKGGDPGGLMAENSMEAYQAVTAIVKNETAKQREHGRSSSLRHRLADHERQNK